MSKQNTIGQFDYKIEKMVEEDPLPFNPRVQFVLKSFQLDADGSPLLPNILMSESEIDEYVRQLKEDLDAISRKAKEALRKGSEKTMSIVSGRAINRRINTSDEILEIARTFASNMNIDETQAEAFAESWFYAVKDDDKSSPEALRSFLALKFELN
jgi:hypothetical protein